MKICKTVLNRAVIVLVAVTMIIGLFACGFTGFCVEEVEGLEIPNVAQMPKFELVSDYNVGRKTSIDILEELVYKDKVRDEKPIDKVGDVMVSGVEESTLKMEEELQKKIEQEYKELPIEDKIKLACDQYGVPFNIALAIARLETGHFTSDAYLYRNNPGGLSRNEVPMSFGSIREGVDYFVSNLSRNYISQGLTTVEAIGEKYCPVNPEWANLVRNVMNM